MLLNSILLRRRRLVVVPDDSGLTSLPLLATLQKNLESLGYLLGEDVLLALERRSPEAVVVFADELITCVRQLVGAHRPFQPMYPNFPEQVMSMSEAQLYWNALHHYWTLERPASTTLPRPALAETTNLRVLHLGNVADNAQLVTLLLQSKTAFGPQDQEDLLMLAAEFDGSLSRLIPASIPCKENLAFFVGRQLQRSLRSSQLFDSHIQTATDVLRVAVAYCGGDVSLAEPCRFTAIPRSIRACLLAWLERASNRTEDMLRWKQRWVRLGERLHPGEYSNRFPGAAESFEILRNRKSFATFNGLVEQAFTRGDSNEALNLLSSRAGELTRRLDHLLRVSDDQTMIVQRFTDVAQNVATPVLLQTLTHFQHRHQDKPFRVFFPKGQIGNLYAVATPLPPLATEVTVSLVKVCEETLCQRFARLPALGQCYLDPAMQNYLVPFATRSAAKALRTLVRGSRLPLPDCSALRFFVWWKNGRNRVDIDLSAAMYDRNAKYVDTLAYYNLKNFGAHHSGDIVDAPNGAAEFIDVNISRCLKKGVRYIVMCLNSFTEQPYCDLPECFAGWMARQKPNSGEIFEARTVQDKIDIAANTRCCLPAIFDLVDRQVIWADIALSTWPSFPNNVQHNLSGVSMMLRALTYLTKTNLHTLFSLHIHARGTLVDARTVADTVFAVDQGITPFDSDRIAAEFL